MAKADDLLVITCAAGRQCKFLIPLLYEKYNLRLVVQTTSSRDRLKQQYPDADVVQADITQRATCTAILKGATRVYHIGPSLHPYEKEIGLFMIDAAVEEHKRTGGGALKHFIFSSVLNTQIGKMYNHDRKRYVEEHLFESGLDYTVLNPCDFLNLAFPVKQFAAMETPEYKSLKGLRSKSAFVVLEDYAEASAKVIDEGEKHFFAQYQMCSMMPVAYGAVAEEVGRALGRKFPISQMPLEEAMEVLGRVLSGDEALEAMDPDMRDGCERLELYYRRRGLQGSPNTMEWVLGRSPTGYKEWIERQVKEAREEGLDGAVGSKSLD